MVSKRSPKRLTSKMEDFVDSVDNKDFRLKQEGLVYGKGSVEKADTLDNPNLFHPGIVALYPEYEKLEAQARAQKKGLWKNIICFYKNGAFEHLDIESSFTGTNQIRLQIKMTKS